MNTLMGRALFACLALVVYGCGGADKPADVAADDKMLLVGNGGDPMTYDPHLVMGAADCRIISAIDEGLVTQHPEDPFAVSPGVAESWSHDKDARVWTFHLRRNAKWSDGSPLSAKDFLYSWRRMLSPDLRAPFAEFYYPIKGAEAFHKGLTSDFATVGIKAPDPQTIVITATAPMPYLPNMLSGCIFAPVHEATVEAGGKMVDRTNKWSEVGSHVGNGAFILVASKLGLYVEVQKNPHYWDAANVKIEGIRFHSIENQKTEMNAFLAGQIHITGPIPPDHLERLRNKNPDAVRSDRQHDSNFYLINTRRVALADRRVRQALSLAIDRQALTGHVLAGGQLALGGLVPAGFPDYDAIPAAPADADKARRLLAAAGYPGGRAFPRIEIAINNSGTDRKQAEAIQAMWKSVLGIEVGILAQDWKTNLSSLQSGDFDIGRASWTGIYPGPGAYLPLFKSNAPVNFTGWANADYDALVEKALATGDPDERNLLFRRAEMILGEDTPIIPLYSNVKNTLVDSRVMGWGQNGTQNFKYVHFRKP